MRLRDLDDAKKVEYLKSKYAGMDAERLRGRVETGGLLEGNILSSKREQDLFFKHIVDGMAVKLASGETDEPVTADVKRLIRMPTSLHGKSSFRVTPLKLKELAAFNPLDDALAFGDEQVTVDAQADLGIALKGESFLLKKGDACELPLYAAMFTLCRGAATIADRK